MAYLWRITLGAVLGGVLGASIYLLLAPWLEDQSGIVREMQGFAWNLVPGLFIVGGFLGWWWAVRSQR